MVRIFRWGSLLVLAIAVTMAGLSYPQLRARILAPVQATATATTISIILPTPTALPSATATSAPVARATLPAVVILPAAGFTATAPALAHEVALAMPPIAFATTSLATELVVDADGEDVSGEGTSGEGASGVGVVMGPEIAANPGGGAFPSPTPAKRQTPIPVATLPSAATLTPVPTVITVTALLTVSFAVTRTPEAAGPEVTPQRTLIPTRDPRTLNITIATPIIEPIIGPYALTDAPLFAGPDVTLPVMGRVQANSVLDIVGRYTEGTWFLLTNGLWLDARLVGNPPDALPLVFPTPTFTPSPTPTVTATPTPTFTPVGPITPTPTPTSLDQEICSCTNDQYDCLGSVFPNRAAAQLCLEYCFRQTGRDIHNLDPNGNGQACENLP
jgi:hypothetical protein